MKSQDAASNATGDKKEMFDVKSKPAKNETLVSKDVGSRTQSVGLLRSPTFSKHPFSDQREKDTTSNVAGGFRKCTV